MQECARECKSVKGSVRMSVKCARVYDGVKECVRVCEGVSEHVRECNNVQGCVRVCARVSEGV